MREQPLIGSAVRTDASAAVWDVSRRSRWAPVLGTEIVDLVAHDEPDADGFWCPRITISFPAAIIDFILGEAGPDQQLRPSDAGRESTSTSAQFIRAFARARMLVGY